MYVLRFFWYIVESNEKLNQAKIAKTMSAVWLINNMILNKNEFPSQAFLSKSKKCTELSNNFLAASRILFYGLHSIYMKINVDNSILHGISLGRRLFT
jgi:hypothetical protein